MNKGLIINVSISDKPHLLPGINISQMENQQFDLIEHY